MSSNVIQLQTLDDYNNLLTNNNKVIVDYSASWCSACDEADPVFDALSVQYPAIKFAKIDIQNTAFTANLKSFNVTSFPTFFYFLNNEVIDTQIGANKYVSTTKTLNLSKQ